MIKYIRLLSLSVALSLFAIASSLSAECVPGAADPCVPTKKIGEWDNSVAVGFNMTSGNSDTKLFTLLGNTYYEKDQDIVTGTVMYNFGEDKTTPKADDASNTTRNDFRALAQYNRLLSERTFVGFGSKFFYDEIADIDYRIFLDPSAGYYLLKDNTFKFRLEAGPSYIFERVGGIKNDYVAPRIADRFEWALSCTSKLYQAAEVLFDVNDSENYLVNAEIGAEAALSTSMSLVVLLRETFDNQPAAGREKDDLAIISALKFSI
jgi:putative salt-induced outer membrane protein YdiY